MANSVDIIVMVASIGIFVRIFLKSGLMVRGLLRLSPKMKARKAWENRGYQEYPEDSGIHLLLPRGYFLCLFLSAPPRQVSGCGYSNSYCQASTGQKGKTEKGV